MLSPLPEGWASQVKFGTAFLSPSYSKVGYSHYPPDKKIPKVAGNKSLTIHQSRYPLDVDLPAFVLNTH